MELYRHFDQSIIIVVVIIGRWRWRVVYAWGVHLVPVSYAILYMLSCMTTNQCTTATVTLGTERSSAWWRVVPYLYRRTSIGLDVMWCIRWSSSQDCDEAVLLQDAISVVTDASIHHHWWLSLPWCINDHHYEISALAICTIITPCGTPPIYYSMKYHIPFSVIC